MNEITVHFIDKPEAFRVSDYATGGTVNGVTVYDEVPVLFRPLPDPGVDVFVYTEDNPSPRLARLESNRKFFMTPRWENPTEVAQQVSVRDVTFWDFAVPAGDLLC